MKGLDRGASVRPAGTQGSAGRSPGDGCRTTGPRSRPPRGCSFGLSPGLAQTEPQPFTSRASPIPASSGLSRRVMLPKITPGHRAHLRGSRTPAGVPPRECGGKGPTPSPQGGCPARRGSRPLRSPGALPGWCGRCLGRWGPPPTCSRARAGAARARAPAPRRWRWPKSWPLRPD